MIKIAFICTGNICRSVMAEGFFREMASAEIKAGDIRVSSAGVAAEEGYAPMPQITAYMRRKGIDVSGYRSRAVDVPYINQNDLLLTMTLHNSQRLLTFDDCAVRKAFTLKEFVLGAEKDGGPPRAGAASERLEMMKGHIRHVEGLEKVDGGDPGSLRAPMQSFFLHYFHVYDQDLSIDDPLGQSQAFLERCAAEIEAFTARLYRLLR